MRFSTDHYFHIGHAHYTAGKPCQDHALSASSERIACAIVSDGCSTGGNTDVGARILTFGTLQAIRDHAKASGDLTTATVSIGARQQQLIWSVRPMIGLERRDLLATCAYAYFTQNGGLVVVQGDGVIGLKHRDGDLVMYRYDWAQNTPFYPSYDGKDFEAFVQEHGGDPKAERLTRTLARRTTECPDGTEETKMLTLEEGMRGIALHIPPDSLKDIEFAAVFSDGVTQIADINWKDAVADFLAFKNTAGEFAKRRMMIGLRNLRKAGKEPFDDISYAVIHIEPGQDENQKEKRE